MYSKKYLLIFIYTIAFHASGIAQFPPPAGQDGSTAIHADSNLFIAWANSCNVERGLIDITNSGLGYTTFGIPEDGTKKADNGVISLGDGGIATLNFDIPIADGTGWDFAVFENSFSEDFLELAFVEVSSNGVDYYRFNAISLTQHATQVSTFGIVDATMVNNLAGKYKAQYGVPFDLSELASNTNLDKGNIISIRITDVIGNIDPDFAQYDFDGNIINDPWPTPFETSGFDLDAVGVINNQDNTDINELTISQQKLVYPNPVSHSFSLKEIKNYDQIIITSMDGKIVKSFENTGLNSLDISNLLPGYYNVIIITEKRTFFEKLIKL